MKTKEKRLINFRLFFITVLCVIACIFAGTLAIRADFSNAGVAAVLFMASGAVLLFFFLVIKRNRWALVVCAAVCVIVSTVFYVQWVKWQGSYFLGEAQISGELEENFIIDYDGKIFYGNLKKVSIDGKSTGYRMRVEITWSSDGVMELADVGDTISMRANITPTSFFTGSSISYSAINKLRYRATNVESPSMQRGKVPPMAYLRRTITNRCYRWLGEEQGAIAAGVLIGNQSDIDGNLVFGFSVLGVAHILSVSGVHISFLAGFLDKVFKRLKLRSLKKAFAVNVILVAFTGVCRWVIPAVRSTVSSVMAGFSKAFGERNDPFANLCVSATFILMLKPFALFDMSMIFSYSATITILLLAPIFRRLLKRCAGGMHSAARDALAVGMAAQVGTYISGILLVKQISLYSVLLNFLLMPLFSAVFVILFCAMLICLILPFMSFLIALAYPLLLAVSQISLALRNLPYAIIVIFASGTSIALMYFTVLWGSRLMMLKRRVKAVSCAVLIGLCLFALAVDNYNPNRNKYAAIAISTPIGVVDLVAGQNGENYLIGDFRYAYLLDELQEQRVSRIDAIFPTVFSLDGVSGMSRVVQRYDVRHMYLPTIAWDAPLASMRGNVVLHTIYEGVPVELGGVSINLHIYNNRVGAYAVRTPQGVVLSLFSQSQDFMASLSSIYSNIALLHSFSEAKGLPPAASYCFNPSTLLLSK